MEGGDDYPKTYSRVDEKKNKMYRNLSIFFVFVMLLMFLVSFLTAPSDMSKVFGVGALIPGALAGIFALLQH